jgi:hypothetical protein
MGVVKGVFEYYKYNYTDAFIFGGSGHAFLINIHNQLCPSSPYCWNMSGFEHLLKLMGLEITDLGFFTGADSSAARTEIQDKIISLIKKGVPCSLSNMENQLIYGFNDEALLTSQPWECSPDFPPKTLTYDLWSEMGEEIHCNFFSYKKTKPASRNQIFKESILYAIELYNSPQKYTFEGYGAGKDAYTNYLSAIDEFGSTHGNWWNATVWSENRMMAAHYLVECAEMFKQDIADSCLKASEKYSEISNLLVKISNKELPASEKKSFLQQASTLENEAIAILTGIHSQI